MHISPTEAVKLYNVSKPTIYKDMEEGKVSFEFDARNKRRLNVAELERVYVKRKVQEQDLTSNTVKNVSGFTELNGNSVKPSTQNGAVQETLIQSKEREIKLLEEKIDQLKDHNEDLKRYIEETREEHRGYMRLLEDKRDKNQHAEIFQEQEHRMSEMMNAMENLMQERLNQDQRIENLEGRLVEMKESGEKVSTKIQGCFQEE